MLALTGLHNSNKDIFALGNCAHHVMHIESHILSPAVMILWCWKWLNSTRDVCPELFHGPMQSVLDILRARFRAFWFTHVGQFQLLYSRRRCQRSLRRIFFFLHVRKDTCWNYRFFCFKNNLSGHGWRCSCDLYLFFPAKNFSKFWYILVERKVGIFK